MINSFSKYMTVTLIGLVSTSVFASCPIDVTQPYIVVNRNESIHTQAVKGQLDAMDLALNTAMNTQAKLIAEAITVWSAQKGVSAQQQSTAIKNNTQVEAQAMQEISRNTRMKKVLRDYGNQSMGYKPCETSKERAILVINTKNTQESVPQMIKREVTAAPGVYSPKIQAMATRLALHDKMYCTSSQAMSGFCSKEAPRAGKSLMAETLFTPSGVNTQEYQDKSAFINNMVGLPDDPISKAAATTVEGQSYADLKRRKDAIKSTAINSLKSIQAQWSIVGDEEKHSEGGQSSNTAGLSSEKQQLAASDAQKPKNTAASAIAVNASSSTAGSVVKKDTTPQPMMIQLKREVDRYLGGGSEYAEWSKNLASQEEKGVLTEILKVKALRLYMQAEQYKQLSRMEAMLAANVAAQTENTGMSGRVEVQRQIALRNAIQNNFNKP